MTLDPGALEFSDEIARSAFRQLLESAEPLSADRIAEEINSSEPSVTGVLTALKSAGRAELDEGGRLLGIYGLTLKPTEHRLLIRGKEFFVWCAWDAIGIPAAIDESATAISVCAHCARELTIEIVHGRPPELPVVISWSPQRCDSVRDEFCPTVNFYCTREHYVSASPGAPEAFISLEAAAELGRQNWGWAASSSNA